ncbi:hypothetical protein [Achromobacter sp. ACM05]|uniref:hypothetical protein n=1 Tax=Achromobacter sp. ACM05 TaxID=2854776 RepID=UPI001C44EA29|nr:hypothetical protein [Achromobacter sp. ACM05]MBV7503014.1 hypothetical protein [Achromobacter sp. ACM05]
MEKMEQQVQQGNAEFRIEAMTADEINQVSGGIGPNRSTGASSYNPHAQLSTKPNVQKPNTAGIRQVFLS